ncbi:class I SAM-dependent methyltransferase [Bradyrhizobium hipponense]|nr:class I SAM-dependent methyltransferase [Bradyrhizobium hipponense]
MSNQQVIVKDPHLCEPFINGRDTGRLLHDLGAMLSLLNPQMLTHPILDFGAGSCWITEAIARMGHRVTAFDIHPDLQGCITGRTSADKRIDASLISYARGDGHAMPFAGDKFGHLLCYDTLHHMHDFDAVFREFSRVLVPGGRAIFVEPGAKHSTSAETIAFLELKKHDPTWIERDIVLEEINHCAMVAGLSELVLMPAGHPSAPPLFSLRDWLSLRRGNLLARNKFAKQLANLNYDQRVIFYAVKP